MGAFGCGVYKALAKSETCRKIDIVSGTSIGGVNAAIIAGSKSARPEEALEQFWLELAENGATGELLPLVPGMGEYASIMTLGTLSHDHDNFGSLLSFYRSAIAGNPKMFVPRWQPDRIHKDPYYLAPHKWTYLYDHSPLAKTLDKYIDYSKLKPGGNPKARLIITAVNIMNAEPVTFDSSKHTLTAKHVLATSAYPLYYFPWVEVEEGLYCWDGGLLSNTPLREVIEASPVAHKRVFIVENYPKKIKELPNNLGEVLHRARDIIFSDKTLHNVQMSRVITRYLAFIDQLYEIVDQSKLDEKTARDIQRKYMKFKLKHGAEIKRIHYITREEEHPHMYENADFSIRAIKNSIYEGETRAREVLETKDEN